MTSETDGFKSWDLERYRTHGSGRAVSQGPIEPSVPNNGRRVRATYDLDPGALFWTALGTSFLSVLTVGIYRFWMVTRLRRHYWGMIRVQGDPIEYTGTGLEKFLGFLIAIVILAAYLAIANLALTFIGLSYLESNFELVFQLSLISAVPFYFWAAYRARRYIASRTRWRGIRFGMDPGALGYMVRAIFYGVLTVLSAGILWPYQQFKLEKYMVDRTSFGDQRFQQNGSWIGLLGYWIWLYIMAGLVGLAAWGMSMEPYNQQNQVVGSIVIFIGFFAFLILYLRYLAGKTKYLWDNRSVGETEINNDVSIGEVVRVYVGGSFLVSLCSALLAGVILTAGGAIWMSLGGPEQIEALMAVVAGAENSGATDVELIVAQLLLAWPTLVIFVFAYLFVMAAGFAFSQVFVTQPVLRRQVAATTIANAEVLVRSRQREEDRAGEAGGFADALGVDVGAGL
ncbi:MAG: DUF898 family protein [Pseudomonadota bacterium]